MAIAAINNWINGTRNFDEGVNLYLRFGEDLFFKAVIKNGKSKRVEEKLYDALIEINAAKDDVEEVVSSSEKKEIELPADLQELQQRINDMYSKLRVVHATIDQLPSKAQRKHAADDIILNFRWIDEAYETINYYKATGERKQDPRVKSIDKNGFTLKEIIDVIKLTPANLSKTRLKMKKEMDPQRISLLSAKLQRWEDDFKMVEDLIEKHGEFVFDK